MFRLYTGEYLVSPVPLHYGLNLCSHACFYCFANLNKPDRQADPRALAKIWSHKNGKDSLEGQLLRAGHPILIANDSDPFAQGNAHMFPEIHEKLTDWSVPIVYQTKGGRRDLEELMLEGKPTMVYVSLTSDKDEVLKSAEPGAPGFAHRLNLMLEAKRKRHHVVWGLNPLIPWWWNDLEGVASQLLEAGIDRMWVGSLHLNPRQVQGIPSKRKTEFLTEIKEAGKKEVSQQWRDTVTDLETLGFWVFHGNTAQKPDFWKPYFNELGYPFFPTSDGWYSHLEAVGKGKPILFSFEDFDRWCNHPNTKPLSAYKEYLVSIRQNIYRELKAEPTARSYRDVHEFYWDIELYPSPLSTFRTFLAGTEDGMNQYVRGDKPLMVYGDYDTDRLWWDVKLHPAIDYREVKPWQVEAEQAKQPASGQLRQPGQLGKFATV